MQLIHKGLLLPPLFQSSPIAHLIPRTPLTIIHSDSSLDSTRGYSSNLGLWWYLEWPPSVHHRTLHYLENNKTKQLIIINTLEYTAILINYLTANHGIISRSSSNNPYPVVQIESDNTTSKAWSCKVYKDSLGCRVLSCIHSALLLGNPVGMQIARLPTTNNVIADQLSCISSIADLPISISFICQDHKALHGC